MKKKNRNLAHPKKRGKGRATKKEPDKELKKELLSNHGGRIMKIIKGSILP